MTVLPPCKWWLGQARPVLALMIFMVFSLVLPPVHLVLAIRIDCGRVRPARV